jgi:hypothetical protein
MGHKVNAVSFRLRKNWDSLYYINNSISLQNSIIQDLFIKKYIERICFHQDRFLLKLKIFRSTSSIIIFIKTFYWKNLRNRYLRSKKKTKLSKYYNLVNLPNLNEHLKLNIQNFFNINNVLIYTIKSKKKQKFLKPAILKNLFYFRYSPFFRKSLRFIKTSFENNNVKLLSFGVAKAIEKNPKHLKYLSLLNKILTIFYRNLILNKLKNFSCIRGYRIEIRGKFNGKSRAKKKIIAKGPMPFSTFDSDIQYSYTTAYTKYGNFGIKVWIFIK